MSTYSLLNRTIILAVFFTALANGGVLWLKKVGWLDSAQHQVLADQWNEMDASGRNLAERYPSLSPQEKGEFLSDPAVLELTEQARQYRQAVRSLSLPANKYEWLASLANDIFLVLFVLVSLTALIDRKLRKHLSCLFKDHIPIIALCLIVLAMGVISWHYYGFVFSLAGLYALVFLFVFLFGSWFAADANLKLFAVMLMWLLVVQLLLASIELFQGIPFSRRIGFLGPRVAGTMQQPSSLGIVAAIGFVFYARYARQARLWFAAQVAVSLIALSGSGMALLVLSATGPIVLYQKTAHRYKLAFWLLAVGAAGLVLFFSTELWGAWERSLSGRIDKYAWYFNLDVPFLNYLLGSGLGNGSNAAIQTATYLKLGSTELFPILSSSDSTPLMLIMQIGIVGCGLVYWIILRAACLDKDLRGVYLAFILASLTTNVIEIYPLNILLGLLLTKSYLLPIQPDQPTDNPEHLQKA